jgi:hypothetical protein
MSWNNYKMTIPLLALTNPSTIHWRTPVFVAPHQQQLCLPDPGALFPVVTVRLTAMMRVATTMATIIAVRRFSLSLGHTTVYRNQRSSSVRLEALSTKDSSVLH